MPRKLDAFCHNQRGQLQMCIVLVAQVGAQVSNNGFVGSNSFWKSSKPIQNGKDFFHCWSFHYILEVLVAN